MLSSFDKGPSSVMKGTRRGGCRATLVVSLPTGLKGLSLSGNSLTHKASSLQPPTKGLGRILPQNIIYLIAPLPGHLLIDGPAPKRRKRMESISKADIDARLLKKEKLDHNNVMDQDNVLPH